MNMRHHLHQEKRTISQELALNITDDFGFWIVITIEKYMVDCPEINGHKTKYLWESETNCQSFGSNYRVDKPHAKDPFVLDC